MPPQRARLHLRQPRSSRGLAIQRGDDQTLPVGLEVEVGVLRDPEQVEDRPIDDDPCAVSDGLQALRHASSINDVHNMVQHSYLLGSYRIATAPGQNSSRLTFTREKRTATRSEQDPRSTESPLERERQPGRHSLHRIRR